MKTKTPSRGEIIIYKKDDKIIVKFFTFSAHGIKSIFEHYDIYPLIESVVVVRRGFVVELQSTLLGASTMHTSFKIR